MPISTPRWMLTFSCSAPARLHSSHLALTLNSSSSYASPPLAFHSYRTFCFGLVWDRVHYVAQSGLNLQWAMPPNCWAYRCAAPCPEKNVFLQFQIFDSNALEANLKKENLWINWTSGTMHNTNTKQWEYR